MTWKWQQKDWPQFTYDPEALKEFERVFLIQSGEFFGAFKHLSNSEKNNLIIDLIVKIKWIWGPTEHIRIPCR